MVNHHPRSAHWAVCLEGAATSSSNDNSIPLEEKIQKYKVYEELDMEANPLLWWKAHQTKYPLLLQLSKKYLPVPATSTPSERLLVKLETLSLLLETLNRDKLTCLPF